jgi:hypothetical protein
MYLSKKAVFISSCILVSMILGLFAQLFLKNQPDSSSYAGQTKSEKLNPVAKCYDSFYSEPIQIWWVQDGKHTYYQVKARHKKASKNSQDFELLYFRLSTYRCENLSRDISGRGRLAFMPKPVAVKFAEQWYQPYFEKCLKSKKNINLSKPQCIKEFENLVNVPPNTKEVSPNFLFTEDEIALNKLGIKTDKALVVDTYADFEKYMMKFRGRPSQPKK